MQFAQGHCFVFVTKLPVFCCVFFFSGPRMEVVGWLDGWDLFLIGTVKKMEIPLQFGGH